LTGARALKILSAAAFVVLCPVLLWNGSRGAVFAVVAACLVLAAFNRRRVLYAAMVLAGLVAAGFVVLNWDQLLHVLNPHAWGNRVELWSSAAAIFLDFPLLGAGPGMYEKLLYVYAPFGNYSEGVIHLHAHNSFLELLAETGLVGACMFSASLICFVRTALRGIARIDEARRNVLLAVSGVVIAGAILALFCTILIVGTQETAVFWFLWGMGAASLNIKERIS
jgi:O-antigen ligase